MDAAAIIAACGVAVAAVAAGVGVWNTFKIRETHLTINSRLDQLLAATKAKAFMDGAADARATDRAAQAALTVTTADAAAKVMEAAAARAATLVPKQEIKP